MKPKFEVGKIYLERWGMDDNTGKCLYDQWVCTKRTVKFATFENLKTHDTERLKCIDLSDDEILGRSEFTHGAVNLFADVYLKCGVY